MAQAVVPIIWSMKSESSDWYRRAFADDYLWLYSHRSEKQARSEVEVAAEHLPFKAGQHILDIACGAGRHMLVFAEIGATVTGVDLSETLLEKAQRRFDEAEQSARLVRSDMRYIPFSGQFDGATMWFTSFGYFPTEEEDFLVLAELSRMLRPGGWWWIDIPNPIHLEANLVPKSEREVDGPNGTAHVIEKRSIENDHVIKVIDIDDPLGHRSYEERVRLYTPERFGSLVRDTGLTTFGILGDYDGSPFTPRVPRQIWYGVKKG